MKEKGKLIESPQNTDWIQRAARRFAVQDANATDANFDNLMGWYASIIEGELLREAESPRQPSADSECERANFRKWALRNGWTQSLLDSNDRETWYAYRGWIGRAELREVRQHPVPAQRNFRRIADGLRRMQNGDNSGPSLQHMLEWAEQYAGEHPEPAKGGGE